MSDHLRRIKFCERFFSFPELCRCNTSFPITFRNESQGFENIKNIPIIIVASNRPYYLMESLKSLLNARGVQKSNIIVDLDENCPESIGLVELFGLKYNIRPAKCSKRCRISSHYKSIFGMISAFNFEHAFIFEDDLIVSSDIFYLFSTTLNVYQADNSIFCVSAWNDHGYKHSVGDLTMLYRVQFMPGLGLVLSKDIVKEILQKWPNRPDTNWDVWIREFVLNGRVCIIPDVSRTFHIGVYGVHINPAFQKSHFEGRFFKPKINVTISVDNLEREEYSDMILYLANNSKEESYENVCKIAATAKSPHLNSWPLSRTELSDITRVVVMDDGMKPKETFLSLFKVWIEGIHYIFIKCPKSSICEKIENSTR
ncbi:Protein O-linked-mannose beta-1,2-N-acetylglucosaminyltransferase 1 [Thelohanellus kitauei]|uniref:Alpha-1,3-mannosyl-glycoprotein 2-beta-N-acetylglucosaminyltransferase n=1 Tax=Thelohanellus kitauei TaxID=669202 RepID=A0A0C2J3N6_THEKT|nr:Protein O-linked-mannose beta-1,2-N-acetylglucosaminyltransferase 1 [Thelohanellus kitauei]